MKWLLNRSMCSVSEIFDAIEWHGLRWPVVSFSGVGMSQPHDGAEVNRTCRSNPQKSRSWLTFHRIELTAHRDAGMAPVGREENHHTLAHECATGARQNGVPE